MSQSELVSVVKQKQKTNRFLSFRDHDLLLIIAKRARYETIDITMKKRMY